MKNTYRVILIGLAVLGIVYAGAGPEKKAEEKCEQTKKCLKSSSESEKKADAPWNSKPIDLCKFTVSMDVGHYVQLKECHKLKIELKQVKCSEINQDNAKFPCYKGSEVFEVRANFPAVFSASINKNKDKEYMLKEVNLYWENGVNSIQGSVGWEELTLCIEVSGAEIWKSAVVGTIEVGEITIEVMPPDDTESEETQ